MGLIRQITVCLAIGVAVTFVTVSSMTVWMADRHNEEAAAATRTMVVGGLSASRRRLEAFTNDYAWWEEGFQAYARGDREWIDGNFGSGVTDTQIADTMVILSPKGIPEYGWNVDGEVDPKSVLPEDVLSQVREMVKDVPIDRSAARSLITRVDDGVLVIGAARHHAGRVRRHRRPRDFALAGDVAISRTSIDWVNSAQAFSSRI